MIKIPLHDAIMETSKTLATFARNINVLDPLALDRIAIHLTNISQQMRSGRHFLVYDLSGELMILQDGIDPVPPETDTRTVAK